MRLWVCGGARGVHTSPFSEEFHNPLQIPEPQVQESGRQAQLSRESDGESNDRRWTLFEGATGLTKACHTSVEHRQLTEILLS